MPVRNNKQMRMPPTHYELIDQLAAQLGISRSEVLSNAIALIKFLVDNEAISVQALRKDGTTKEIMMAMLIGNWMK